MRDNTSLQKLRQAKAELREIFLKILPQYAGIGIGTIEDTLIRGTGGELEKKLTQIPAESDFAESDLCIRINLKEMPPPEIELPSTYRGIPLCYVIVDKYSKRNP